MRKAVEQELQVVFIRIQNPMSSFGFKGKIPYMNIHRQVGF
jgi:hypothetical protein